jgi:hypothetical protein
MVNKRGKVTSIKRHKHGLKVFEHIRPHFEAKEAERKRLRITGFCKPKKDGTPEEKQLYMVMLREKVKFHAEKGGKAKDELALLEAEFQPPSAAPEEQAQEI